MNPIVFTHYRHSLENHFHQQGHHNLSQFFAAEMAHAVYSTYPRRAIKTLSAYLPYNQQLMDNPYLLQGGGNYDLMEVAFTSGRKAIIHTVHIYMQNGTLPMPQKHGCLVDLMIRLNYLKTLPGYENALTYMVLISDHVMVNYQGGFAFEEKNITPVWIAGQVAAFQNAIIGQFNDHVQEAGLIEATHYAPIYTNPDGSFGMGVWQIN